jgi:hypothetical protein
LKDLLRAVAASCLAATTALSLGCQGGRVASCRTDDDCGSDMKGFCVDAICAQCRGEDDCRAPLICGRDHRCKSLTPSTERQSSSHSE